MDQISVRDMLDKLAHCAGCPSDKTEARDQIAWLGEEIQRLQALAHQAEHARGVLQLPEGTDLADACRQLVAGPVCPWSEI